MYHLWTRSHYSLSLSAPFTSFTHFLEHGSWPDATHVRMYYYLSIIFARLSKLRVIPSIVFIMSVLELYLRATDRTTLAFC
jgi:hypothetical protein